MRKLENYLYFYFEFGNGTRHAKRTNPFPTTYKFIGTYCAIFLIAKKFPCVQIEFGKIL